MLRLGTKLASRLVKGSGISKEFKLIAQSLRSSNLSLIDTGVTYYYPKLDIMSLDYKPMRFFGSEPSHTKLTMPALSPTMTQGTIVKWNKKPGDLVDVGEVIADVETDKATVGFEIQEKGYLAKILVQEGTKDILVGKVVAILVDDEKDVKAFENYQVKDTGGEAKPSGGAKKSEESKPKEETQQKGGSKQAEESKQTEKPKAQSEGSHHKGHRAHRASIQFRHVKSKPGEERQDAGAKKAATDTSTSPKSGRIFVSPLAKKYARENNIPLDPIKGSGPNGRILFHDVKDYKPAAKTEQPAGKTEKAAERPGIKFPADAKYVDIPVSAEGKKSAQRYVESKNTIPHYYLSSEIVVDQLLSAIQQLNAGESREISNSDIIIKAAGLALRDVPEVNSQWHGNAIHTFRNADIALRYVGDSHVAPIVRAANSKSLSEISSEVKDFASRAKTNQFGKEEIEGATFSIANLSLFGVVRFAPIIDPPQAAILGVGAIRKKYTTDEKGNLKVINVMHVTLSCDHRVVDGAVGAKWLLVFKNYLEKPVKMLL